MDLTHFRHTDEFEWRIDPQGAMRVPGIIYADRQLILDMDDKVYEQLTNVATLPGVVNAAYAMPDAHWGYGFPIGGVAAFDADQGGVISAGGVGFDISCGVRTMLTELNEDAIERVKQPLGEALYSTIPVGMGNTGDIRLGSQEMDEMLIGGAEWAVRRGYGIDADLERIEERGHMRGAKPGAVSERARKRQRDEMGTLGSGNHYLEVQAIAEIFDAGIASAFGLRQGQVVVSIHCGSRGLGHQIGTEFLSRMAIAAAQFGIALPDRELACVPLKSDIGQSYLGAMRAAINCALANRQIIGHYTRRVFNHFFPDTRLPLLFDVSHNTCKLEEHEVAGERRQLYIHRKGATRAFGPGHPDLPEPLKAAGQPVLIGGSMGTASYILAGVASGKHGAFSSACHGAGRCMSRHEATRQWNGRSVRDELATHGILVFSPSMRGIAEEAPGAYKDVTEVVEVTERAGLARKVARLHPLICIKG